MPTLDSPIPTPATDAVRVFAIYDREHDEDLVDQLVEESLQSTLGFVVSGQSVSRAATDHWDETLRHSIQQADQVIVICGETTDQSVRVAAELRIAQEEKRPYFLLWGRREPMCTRPSTASSTDSMYSWTPEILRYQILTVRRLAEADERTAERARAAAAAS